LIAPDRPSGAPAGPPSNRLLQVIRDGWDQLIGRALDEGNPELGAALAAAEVLEADARHLTLAIPIEHRAWLAEGHPHRQRLEMMIAGLCGSCPPIQLQTLYREGQGGSQTDARNQRYREAQALPLVKDLLKRFAGDIVAREPSARDAFLARCDGAPGGADGDVDEEG
jgi:hypothetical protein